MSVSLDKAKEVRKGEGIDAAVLSAYLAKALDKPEGEVVIKQSGEESHRLRIKRRERMYRRFKKDRRNYSTRANAIPSG